MIEERTDERSLADTLGLGRQVLRKIRSESLELGTHWERGHGGRIEYTPGGVAQVREILAESAPQNSPEDGLEQADPTPELETPAPAAPASRETPPVPLQDIKVGEKKPPLTAIITRIPRNSRILLARLGQSDTEVVVRVRDNAFFIPKQEIPVRHVQGATYELACAQPRKKGRLLK